jgi:hypothetical protein
MSMNKTCAISNFTSEERSGGMSDFVLSELFRFNEPILARHFSTSTVCKNEPISAPALINRRNSQIRAIYPAKLSQV